jgi:hypothetical protein
MRGTYRSMFDYDLDIVALTEFGPLAGHLYGDFDGDGLLNLTDYGHLLTWLHTDVSQLPEDEAYARGDLNGDYQVNALDFFAFRQAYDDEHGPGALAKALAAVPEPSTLHLAAAAAALAATRRR